MSIKSATEAIEMIDAVAERSHSYTIASAEIVGAINSCIYTICSEQKLNWEAFIKKARINHCKLSSENERCKS